jgi:dienelactone hydrolase
MKHLSLLGLSFASLLSLTVGCGGNGDTNVFGTGGASGGTGGASGTGTATDAATGVGGASTSGAGTGGSATTTTGSGMTTTTTTTGATTGAGGGSATADPTVDGPYTIKEIDDTTTVKSTGHSMPVHAAFPSAGPSAGPFPVVLVAHGFQLDPKQYLGYVKRLATFGYVAITPNFAASLFSVNNVENAKDVIGAIDWAKGRADLHADTDNVGASGHSLGGKIALLAATMDSRIKASITLDPVDGAMNCNATNCPDVSNLMPTLKIPVAFLGETTDASGGSFGMSCAPAANNYTTFYASAKSPTFEVTVNGANHMSFLDDVAGCGLTCSLCNKATVMQSKVLDMSRAYLVAFYERNLRGNAGYDTYLTGAKAQELFVKPGLATITSK